MTGESKASRVLKDYAPHIIFNALALVLPLSFLEEFKELIATITVTIVELLILLSTRASVIVYFRHPRVDTPESRIILERNNPSKRTRDVMLVVKVKGGGLFGYWALKRLGMLRRDGGYLSIGWKPTEFLKVEQNKKSDTVSKTNTFLNQYPFGSIQYRERHSNFRVAIKISAGKYSDKEEGEIVVSLKLKSGKWLDRLALRACKYKETRLSVNVID